MQCIVCQVVERIDPICFGHVSQFIRKVVIIPMRQVPEPNTSNSQINGKLGKSLYSQTVLIVKAARKVNLR